MRCSTLLLKLYTILVIFGYFICTQCYNHFLVPTFINLQIYISSFLFYLCLDFVFKPFSFSFTQVPGRVLMQNTSVSPPFPVVILVFLIPIGLQIKCDSCALWKS